MHDTDAPAAAAGTSPMPAGADIHRVELVRVGDSTSLLRVQLAAGAPRARDVALVVRGVGLPRRLLPLPTPDTGSGGRYAFAIPAAMRGGRYAISLDGREVQVGAPIERTRDDALAALQLQHTRARLAELERRADEERDAGAGARTERLEQQLGEHRLLRAQLGRELEAAQARQQAAEAKLEQLLAERELLEQTLEDERAEHRAERSRLEEALDAARARVDYLERRIVELRARDADDDDPAR